MRSILLAGCVLALVVSTASAQDQEKPRRPGGGFGGRGGGPGGGGQDTLGILSMPEVQKELGLDDAKKKEVGEIVEKTQQELMASFNFRELQGLSDEERQKKMEEFRKKGEELNKKAVEQVGKVLDSKQFERFRELRLQREGVAALGRPEVAQKLELSQEQKDKVKKIQDDSRRDAGGGAGFGRLSDEERREYFAKREERAQKVNSDLLAVLTSAQKESWEKMLGKKFDFPQRQFGGPGGGGRRGGPGGGGGGGEKGEKKRPEAKKDA
jgi:hypothetical protein